MSDNLLKEIVHDQNDFIEEIQYDYKNEILVNKNKNLNDIENKVEKFYDTITFPNYENDDTLGDLVKKSNNNPLIKSFCIESKMKKKVLEIGSGSCQLSNYLAAVSTHKIYALDLSFNALQEGRKFFKNNINNKSLVFCNFSIFENPFKAKTMDYIFALGCLHHTYDTKKAFKEATNLLKDDGIIIVSLYNKIGRANTSILKYLSYIFTKKIIKIFDPALKKIKSQKKQDTWINDQYFNPNEFRHSYDEVIEWSKESNLEILNFYPDPDTFFSNPNIFEKRSLGSKFFRLLTQIKILFNTRDGGLFFFTAKKIKK